MKVLLDVASLAPPLTGIGTYTLNLRNGLLAHPIVEQLSVFTRNDLLPGSNAIPESFRKTLRRVPFAHKLRDGVSAYRLSRKARQGYVYHEPNYLALPYDGPCVVSVADLSHLHYPHYHPPERVQRLNRHLEKSLAHAHEVICHSAFIRDEVVSMLGLSTNKVNVVYPGASDAFRPRAADEMQPVLRRYGLEGQRYLLSVGAIEPRKNLVGLIGAYSALSSELRRSFPLVLAGPRGWLTGPIERAMSALEHEHSLRWLGYVPSEELPIVYAGAHAFAYLSFYEGFGLPVIEAMASGVPVMTSVRSAMAEIAEGAALLVDPEDGAAIACGLQRLLEDDGFRQHAAAAGREGARKFSWDTCVNETVAIYEKALRTSAM